MVYSQSGCNGSSTRPSSSKTVRINVSFEGSSQQLAFTLLWESSWIYRINVIQTDDACRSKVSFIQKRKIFSLPKYFPKAKLPADLKIPLLLLPKVSLSSLENWRRHDGLLLPLILESPMSTAKDNVCPPKIIRWNLVSSEGSSRMEPLGSD